jgi:hypothetical protein
MKQKGAGTCDRFDKTPYLWRRHAAKKGEIQLLGPYVLPVAALPFPLNAIEHARKDGRE